uniref:peptidylprolyl isomerase n=1 Tax=Ditylenchus dipsaci TaxID=166011 RepID=A0A915DSL2_9BILA
MSSTKRILPHRLFQIAFCLVCFYSTASCSDNIASSAAEGNALGKKKKQEDTIPVIEIRGEGKPMTSAQIRNLEEVSNGGPLDIKIEKTWVPGDCPRAAKRLDFVTFHYKGFSETGKKFDQSYGRLPNGVRFNWEWGWLCLNEQENKSKMWRYFPNDEHWLSFNIEMITVEEWTLERQFQFMDLNNDTYLTQTELVKLAEHLRREFGKTWSNEDIDNVMAAKYYIKYFDANSDGKVDFNEFQRVIQRDMATIAASRSSTDMQTANKAKSSKKVDVQEMDAADQVLEGEPAILPHFAKEEL